MNRVGEVVSLFVFLTISFIVRVVSASAVPCCSNVQVLNFGPNIKSHTEAVEYVTDTTVVNMANGWIRQYKPIAVANTDMFTPQGYERRAAEMDNGLIKSGADVGGQGCPAVALSNISSDNADPIAAAWKQAGYSVAATTEARWREALRPLNGWGK